MNKEFSRKKPTTYHWKPAVALGYGAVAHEANSRHTLDETKSVPAFVSAKNSCRLLQSSEKHGLLI